MNIFLNYSSVPQNRPIDIIESENNTFAYYIEFSYNPLNNTLDHILTKKILQLISTHKCHSIISNLSFSVITSRNCLIRVGNNCKLRLSII